MFKKAKENKKGFTLAELLIVVAIIAVLVAISIPIFTQQLEKSRDAVTVANLRAAYAEAQTAYLTGEKTGDATYTAANGDTSATVSVTGVKAKGTKTGFSSLEGDLPFTAPTDMGDKAGTYTVTFTYDADGKITDTAATKTGN